MWVVIDTNIFYDDLRLKKSLDLLFRKIENVQFSLRIPEVVVQETINIYKEQRQSHLSKFLSHAKELKSLTSLEIEISFEEGDITRDIEEYEHFLRKKILSNGDIVPLPELSLQTLIDRDLARRKPFKENGVGFRDALIWETILALVIRDECKGVAFITKNAKDFLEKDKLHPHLIQDVEERHINPDVIKLFSSIEQFIDALVIPALSDIEGIRDAIANATHPNIDLDAITENYIWDLITGFEVDPHCLPNYCEDNDDLAISAGVREYEMLSDDLSVKRLSNVELLITASYKLDCELDVFVPRWETFYESFEEQGFFLSDPDWNETYALASIVLPFKITLRYIYNQQEEEITSADIVSAECLRDDDE